MKKRFYSTRVSCCARRRLDQERFTEYFIKNDYMQTHNAEEADYIVIVSCVSTEANIKLALSLVEKHSGIVDGKKLIVIGCINHPDILFKIKKNKDKVLAYFAPKDGLETIDEHLDLPHKMKTIRDPQTFLESQNTRIVRVEWGCSGKCTYCIAKRSIGYTKSKPLEVCMKEVEKHVLEKVKYIRLMGDDVGSYGNDINTTLGELLRRVNSTVVDQKIIIDNINVQYLIKYKKIILEMVKENKIRQLQVPIQHTIPRILHLMNRYVNVEQIEEIINEIENYGNTFTETHIIVGFPSESEQELRECARYCMERLCFNKIGFYPYVDNRDADSYKLNPKVSLQEKIKRMKIINKISENYGKIDLRYIENGEGLFELRIMRWENSKGSLNATRS